MAEPVDGSAGGDAPIVPCPICGRRSDPVLRPFCSKRCADVDLHRWLSGGYRVPSDEEPDDIDDISRNRDADG